MSRTATDNQARALTVGAVEPYFGGSHKQFLEDLAAHSRHRFEFFTQPARKWKWRMRGSALHFLGEVERLGACDLLLVSDFLNLAEFLGLARGRWPRGAPPPIAMFMHENQLTYPVRHEDERDYHYGFINIVGCLAADEVWFNSAFHRDEFLAAAPAFLKRMPDAVPKGLDEALALRARVLHLGVASPGQEPPPRATGAPLRIGWNHRWEFDKNPEAFFAALFALHDGGVPFEAVVLGERYRDSPAVFEEARVRLGERIAHWGFAPSRADYARLLASCDVTVSTAAHEFFGLSTVEACLHGCAVLLPNRLSYPELVPPGRHARVLYRDDADLVERLRAYAAAPESARALGAELRADFARFAWPERIAAFDDAVAALAVRKRDS